MTLLNHAITEPCCTSVVHNGQPFCTLIVTDTHQHIDRVLYTYMTSYLAQSHRLSILIDKPTLFLNSCLIILSVDNVLLINTRSFSIVIDKVILLSIGISTSNLWTLTGCDIYKKEPILKLECTFLMRVHIKEEWWKREGSHECRSKRLFLIQHIFHREVHTKYQGKDNEEVESPHLVSQLKRR
jgi:hypothetical protein